MIIVLDVLVVFLTSLVACMRSGLLQPAIATAVTTNLTMLQDTVSNLERICNTPLPFAYQAHLRMSLWLYLFFLPVRNGLRQLPSWIQLTFLPLVPNLQAI